MFERFTEKARRVIFFARYQASQDGSPYIETTHLLAGLLRESKNLLAVCLPGRAQEFADALQTLRESRRLPQTGTTVDLPVSKACRRVLAYATEEADKLSHRHIGSEHLLLGMLREEQDSPSLLTQFGITLETVRGQVAIAAETPSQPPAGVTFARRRPTTSREHADGCLEIVDTGGNRLAVIGLSVAAAIPRIGEDVQLAVDGEIRKFRVVDVSYLYKPNTPNSEYKVHHLAAVQVWVSPAVSPSEAKVLPDAT